MKDRVTKSKLNPLEALASLVCGERTYAIAEANSIGFYTVLQIAEAGKTSKSNIDRKINDLLKTGKVKRIKIAGRGGGWAYKPA